MAYWKTSRFLSVSINSVYLHADMTKVSMLKYATSIHAELFSFVFFKFNLFALLLLFLA